MILSFWLFLKQFDWNTSVYQKISSFGFWSFSFLVFRPSNGLLKSHQISSKFVDSEFLKLSDELVTYISMTYQAKHELSQTKCNVVWIE